MSDFEKGWGDANKKRKMNINQTNKVNCRSFALQNRIYEIMSMLQIEKLEPKVLSNHLLAKGISSNGALSVRGI